MRQLEGRPDEQAQLSTIYDRREADDFDRGGAAGSHALGGVSDAQREFGAGVSVACRRSASHDSQALQKVDSREKSQPDAQTARLQAELDRMCRVVAEITAENLELKKL
jgi:hypothetical protein